MRRSFAFGVAVSILVACGTPQPKQLSADVATQLAPTGSLRVGVAYGPDASPALAVLDANKEPKGVPVSLGQEIAKAAGVPVEFKVAPNTGQLTDWLAARELDVAFMPVDEVRRKRVDFGPDYFILESTFLIRPGLKLTRLADIDRPGVRVVGIANTATMRAASGALKTNTVTAVPTADAAIEMLRSGQADAFAFPRDALAPIAERMPGASILQEAFLRTGVAVALPKERPEALRFVTQFMEDAKSSGLVKRAFANAGLANLEVAP